MNDFRIYKPNKFESLMVGGIMLFLIFVGLTLPILIEGGPTEPRRLAGLAGFWLFGILLTVVPFGFTMKIGSDFVKTYFLGSCIRDLRRENVRVLEYGNLFHGGLGFGKGLKGWEKRTERTDKYFSIGENFWSKEAIAHAKRALEPQ